jgi:YgiT-type zinc finger domain-containing protein
MGAEVCNETMVERTVTYVLELNGQVIIIENVPARVCEEIGESFFSSETVQFLQQIAWEGRKPSRTVEIPVFEFAA